MQSGVITHIDWKHVVNVQNEHRFNRRFTQWLITFQPLCVMIIVFGSQCAELWPLVTFGDLSSSLRRVTDLRLSNASLCVMTHWNIENPSLSTMTVSICVTLHNVRNGMILWTDGFQSSHYVEWRFCGMALTYSAWDIMDGDALSCCTRQRRSAPLAAVELHNSADQR